MFWLDVVHNRGHTDSPLAYSTPFLDATRSEADPLRGEAEQLPAAAAEHLAAAEQLSADALHRTTCKRLDQLLGRLRSFVFISTQTFGSAAARSRDRDPRSTSRPRPADRYRDWYELVENSQARRSRPRPAGHLPRPHLALPARCQGRRPRRLSPRPDAAGERAMLAVEAAAGSRRGRGHYTAAVRTRRTTSLKRCRASDSTRPGDACPSQTRAGRDRPNPTELRAVACG